MTRTTEQGTTLLDLKNAARSLGFQVEGVEISFSGLHKHLAAANGYAILHAESEHFFPAFGAVGDKVRVLDPAIGIEEVDEQQLRSSRYRWSGKALLLTGGREG